MIGMRALASGSFFAAEAFVPLALTSTRHASLTAAGLVLTAGAVSWALGSQVQGRTTVDRVVLARTGLTCASIAVLLLPFALRSAWPVAMCGSAWFLGAFGMGMFFPSQGVLLLRYSEPADQGRNSASLQVSDSLGGVVLLSVAGAVQASQLHGSVQSIDTFTVIWVGLGLFAVAGALLVGRMRVPS